MIDDYLGGVNLKFLKFLFAFVFSMVIWFLISYGYNDFSYTSIGIGVFASVITGFIAGGKFTLKHPLWLINLRRVYIFIFYIPILVCGFLKQGVITSWHIITNNYKESTVVKIPTKIKSSYGMLLLSSAISVSSNTLLMDIEDDEDNDEKYLYIHCTNIDKDKIDDADKIVKEEHETWIRRICEE